MNALGGSVFAPWRSAAQSAVKPLAASGIVAAPHDGAGCDHRGHITLAPLPPPLIRRSRADGDEDTSSRRTRIWEFDSVLHCSIIGTCLSTAELRQALTRIGQAKPGQSDHDLHHQGVSLAARPDLAAKLLQKTLDRRHKLAISQFARARTEAEVQAMWRDAVRKGDIPGGYWATLTHPAATRELIRLAFGEVHMLSHLVGAANRADIRRLCDLEQRNATLEEKLARQQDALHAAVLKRDAEIRDLREALRRKLRQACATPAPGETDAVRALAGDLEKRLSAEARRRTIAEGRLAEASRNLARRTATQDAMASELAQLRTELAAIEPDEPEDTPRPQGRLDGLSLLYVGGRPNQVAHMRALSERRGATLLHHDGGMEQHSDLLAGMTSRADIVLFPVDCISHDAALNVKRLCRQAGKRFVPLRSSGTASFLAALLNVKHTPLS